MNKTEELKDKIRSMFGDYYIHGVYASGETENAEAVVERAVMNFVDLIKQSNREAETNVMRYINDYWMEFTDDYSVIEKIIRGYEKFNSLDKGEKNV